MRRPYVLAKTNWKAVKDEKFTVAVLPWGATEAHNYHMPYGTDNILGEHVAVGAAAKAWNHKAKVIFAYCPFWGEHWSTGCEPLHQHESLHPIFGAKGCG